MPQKTKIYLIGDKDGGMTIVITDPILVVQYSKEDLDNAAAKVGGDVRAGIVRHLLPQLRGVDVPILEKFLIDHQDTPHGTYTFETEAAFLRELHFADTVAQHVAEGSGVFDVDFCVALEADVSELVIRGRKADPGESIGQYLDENSEATAGKLDESDPRKPKRYDIGGFRFDHIGKKPVPWTVEMIETPEDEGN